MNIKTRVVKFGRRKHNLSNRKAEVNYYKICDIIESRKIYYLVVQKIPRLYLRKK